MPSKPTRSVRFLLAVLWLVGSSLAWAQEKRQLFIADSPVKSAGEGSWYLVLDDVDPAFASTFPFLPQATSPADAPGTPFAASGKIRVKEQGAKDFTATVLEKRGNDLALEAQKAYLLTFQPDPAQGKGKAPLFNHVFQLRAKNVGSLAFHARETESGGKVKFTLSCLGQCEYDPASRKYVLKAPDKNKVFLKYTANGPLAGYDNLDGASLLLLRR